MQGGSFNHVQVEHVWHLASPSDSTTMSIMLFAENDLPGTNATRFILLLCWLQEETCEPSNQ
jgi:hypothetical protein